MLIWLPEVLCFLSFGRVGIKPVIDFRGVDGRCRTGTSRYRLEKKQPRLLSCSSSRFSAVPFLNTLGVFGAILIAMMIKTAENQKRKTTWRRGGDSNPRYRF